MSWDCSIAEEIGEMFDVFSWRADELLLAVEKRIRTRQEKERERQRSPHLVALKRAWRKRNPEKAREISRRWRERNKSEAQRAYMREYKREYDRNRRAADPAYTERQRKHVRESMARSYARKRGQLIELRKRGMQLPNRPHKEHRCTACHQTGHNRLRCVAQKQGLS